MQWLGSHGKRVLGRDPACVCGRWGRQCSRGAQRPIHGTDSTPPATARSTGPQASPRRLREPRRGSSPRSGAGAGTSPGAHELTAEYSANSRHGDTTPRARDDARPPGAATAATITASGTTGPRRPRADRPGRRRRPRLYLPRPRASAPPGLATAAPEPRTSASTSSSSSPSPSSSDGKLWWPRGDNSDRVDSLQLGGGDSGPSVTVSGPASTEEAPEEGRDQDLRSAGARAPGPHEPARRRPAAHMSRLVQTAGRSATSQRAPRARRAGQSAQAQTALPWRRVEAAGRFGACGARAPAPRPALPGPPPLRPALRTACRARPLFAASWRCAVAEEAGATAAPQRPEAVVLRPSRDFSARGRIGGGAGRTLSGSARVFRSARQDRPPLFWAAPRVPGISRELVSMAVNSGASLEPPVC